MAKREKCGKCKINFQGFHICLDLDPEVMRQVSRHGRTYPNRASGDYHTSEENVDKLRDATLARHAADRLLNADRDREIIEKYKTDQWTIKDLCEHYGVGRNQMSRILHEAQDRGEVTIRPRGVTIRRWPQPA